MTHESLDRFAHELYDELRRMAHRQLAGERPDHTLCTTDLVHEAYLKLGRLERIEWQSRAHFFAGAAQAMRRVLVDHAVRRGAGKRGGKQVRVEFDENLPVTDEVADQLLALHEALQQLEASQPRLAKVVECRFFAGMTVEEIGEVLGVSPATVKRDWQLARAWLNREMNT